MTARPLPAWPGTAVSRGSAGPGSLPAEGTAERHGALRSSGAGRAVPSPASVPPRLQTPISSCSPFLSLCWTVRYS